MAPVETSFTVDGMRTTSYTEKRDISGMEAAAEMKVGAQSVSESSVEASTSLTVESEVEESVIAAAEAAVVNNISPQSQPIRMDTNAVEVAAEMKVEDLSASNSIEASTSSMVEQDVERRVVAAAEFTAARNVAQAIPVSPPVRSVVKITDEEVRAMEESVESTMEQKVLGSSILEMEVETQAEKVHPPETVFSDVVVETFADARDEVAEASRMMLLEKNAERLVEGKVDRNVESQVEQKVMSTFSISSTSTSDFGVKMMGTTTDMSSVENLEQVTTPGSYLNEINGNSNAEQYVPSVPKEPFAVSSNNYLDGVSSRDPIAFHVPMASHNMLDSSTLETTQGNAESLNSFKTEAVHKNESSYLHQIGGNDVVEKYVPPSPKIPSSGGLNGYIDRVASSPPIAFSPRQAPK